MAGQPMKRAVLTRIKAMGGFRAIYDRIANGETLQKIAQTYDCSGNFLRRIITANDKALSLYRAARADSAAALVEKSMDELEAFQPSSLATANAEVSLLRLRTEHRRWLAEKYDKEFFGEKKDKAPQVNLNLNIGDLHLEAMRQLPRPAAVVRQLESGNNLDVETIPHE